MSMKHNSVNWFEIPATDLDRAKAFYLTTFGYELTDAEMGPARFSMFAADHGLPGAGGCLMQSEGYTPSHAGTMVYFPVPDIEATLAKIGAAGGKTLIPKTPIGEHGHIAHFEDTEGNRVGLHTPPGGLEG